MVKKCILIEWMQPKEGKRNKSTNKKANTENTIKMYDINYRMFLKIKLSHKQT